LDNGKDRLSEIEAELAAIKELMRRNGWTVDPPVDDAE
jgi:hypothetical protein